MLKRLFNWTIGLLLIAAILFPTVWQPAKISVLAIALVLALALLLRGSARISKTALIGSMVFAFSGVAWTLYGVVEGNPGALPMMTIMVAYPLILPALAFCYRREDATTLNTFFINAALFIAVFDIAFIVLSVFAPGNSLSNYIFDLYLDEAVIDNADSYFKFTIPNISSLIFLLPFTLTYFLHTSRNRILLGVSIIMLLIIMILSGRRALFVSPIVGIFLAYAITANYSRNNSRSNALRVAKTLLAVVLVVLLGSMLFSGFYGAEFYLEQIISIFDFDSNESNLERRVQFNSLLDGIAENPFWGAGSGAAATYTRSIEQPWAYELAYVAFVFHFGLIGFVIYGLGVLFLIHTLRRQTLNLGRNSFEFHFLAGMLSFLVANSSNPYLAKFDYMWVIFIPYAIMNLQILRRSKANYLDDSH